MKPIAPEIIARAIEILGTDNISEDEIEKQVGELTTDPMEARRLIDWIPEAFGMVLVAQHGVRTFRTFSAKNAQGKWKSIPVAQEPIFAAAVIHAQSMFHGEPHTAFENIANRSAEVSSASEMLSAGKSLAGAVSSGPELLGIPAEIYGDVKEGLGKRLFAALGVM
jgi:hypothetical protein